MATRISYAQAKALGLTTKEAKPRGMNRWEEKFAAELAAWKQTGMILSYGFEAIKLRLAKKTFYTPDFFTVPNLEDESGVDKRLTFWEVKGFWRDDARVKIKVAAETYRGFRFVVVTLIKGGHWKYEEVRP